MRALLFIVALALAQARGVLASEEEQPPAAAAQEESVRIISHNQVCAPDQVIKYADWLQLHFSATIDETSAGGDRGKVLQSSQDVGVPISIQLKKDDIVQGWIDGLVGVACEGSKIELVVPPSLGFGDDLTVRFAIDILQVSQNEIEEPSLFDVIDANQDGQISAKEFSKYFIHKRPMDLSETGEPPMGLFLTDDVNQNKMLNWEEFSGPKGTAPPSVAAEIVAREKLDPELTKFKKGDPLQTNIHIDLGNKEIKTEEDYENDIANQVKAAVAEEFHAEAVA